MKAVKAIYQNGQITLSEQPPDLNGGTVDVLVVFPEAVEDPWQRILDDPTPRPALARKVREVEEAIAQGKTIPLDLGQL